jgi:hypothetical protein
MSTSRTKTEYLYGKYTPPEIPKDIIEQRIKCLDKHINDLISVDFWNRDAARLNAALKAKSFWEKFLKKEEL